MSINLVVAVTDNDWFEMLRQKTDLSEVNFWAMSALLVASLGVEVGGGRLDDLL
jgi:hypothetical protein